MATSVKFVRGSTLRWTSYFTDIDGVLTVPPSAKVYIAYQSAPGTYTTLNVNMVYDGSKYWTADWDTRSIMPCEVDWSVVPAGAAPVAREDGKLLLTANQANPVP